MDERDYKAMNDELKEEHHIGDTNKMVTSVEWFAREINKINVSTEARLFIEKLKNRAKDMEEEQIKDAFKKGRTQGVKSTNNANYSSLITEEEYYNQTFKK